MRTDLREMKEMCATTHPLVPQHFSTRSSPFTSPIYDACFSRQLQHDSTFPFSAFCRDYSLCDSLVRSSLPTQLSPVTVGGVTTAPSPPPSLPPRGLKQLFQVSHLHLVQPDRLQSVLSAISAHTCSSLHWLTKGGLDDTSGGHSFCIPFLSPSHSHNEL